MPRFSRFLAQRQQLLRAVQIFSDNMYHIPLQSLVLVGIPVAHHNIDVRLFVFFGIIPLPLGGVAGEA